MNQDQRKVQRVLMTSDTLGGAFNYAVTLARGLADLGLTTVLVTMGRAPSRDQRALLHAVPGLELHGTDLALEWMEAPWSDVDAAGELLLKLEAEAKADLVHVNGYAHAALPFRAPVVAVAHSCVLSWWRAVRKEDAPSSAVEYQRRVRAGLCAAGAVVAPTRAMLGALHECYGPIDNGLVIPNGADCNARLPRAKEHLFLAAGRFWDQGKNLLLLRDAAPHLPWPLYLAGEGAGRASALHELGSLAQSDLWRWMARAAVFLHPARYEPFGLAPLEAALHGCALVLGKIDSLREIWGDAASYVEPDDCAELILTARRLAENGAERERLAARARDRAAQFSGRAMARAYADLYETVAGKARRAA
jgi:glycogen synthase